MRSLYTPYVALTLATSLFTLNAEEIAVNEESLPKKPTQEQNFADDKGPLIVPELKGCVLVDDKVHLPSTLTESGLHIDLKNVPGGMEGLQERLKPFIGKPLHQSDLDQLVAVIEGYYRENGKPIILIQIPTPQSLTKGCVQMIVRCARVGSVTVKGNKYFSSSDIRNHIKLNVGDEIDQNQLIKNLNFINRNSFRRAKALYTPGATECTTDVEIDVQDIKPYRFYGGTDNTGNAATGRERYFAGVNFANIFNRGHLLSYQYTTNDFNRFNSHTAYYAAPLPWNHMLSFFGGYSSVDVTIPTTTIQSRGDSWQLSGRYTVPLYGYDSSLMTECTFGFDFKQTNNNVLDTTGIIKVGKTNVNLTQLYFQYLLSFYQPRRVTFFNTEIFYSPGKTLSKMAPSDYSMLRPGATASYAYGRFSFLELVQLNKGFEITFNLRGQVASNNLLPSETFGLGGYSTIRGFEERQASTDNGVIFNFELLSPSKSLFTKLAKDNLRALIFIDAGGGVNYDRQPGDGPDPWLCSVGPGLRYNANANVVARLDWGFRIRSNTALANGGNKLHFSFVAGF